MNKAFQELAANSVAEQKRGHWFIEVPPGTSLAFCLDPMSFQHSQGKIRRNDLVEIVSSDGVLDVLLRCVSVTGGLPLMKVLRLADEPAVALGPSGYRVEFSPETGQFVAIANAEEIGSFASRDQAMAALEAIR